MAQPTHLLDQQFLHFVGGLQRAFGIAGEVHDALNPFHHRRLLTELLDELNLTLAELVAASVFMLHPHPIEPTVYICTFYSAEISAPLTRF